MSNWAWFWLFASVFIVCDTTLFLRGFDSFFWGYKTPNELEYQRKKLGLDAQPTPTPTAPTKAASPADETNTLEELQ